MLKNYAYHVQWIKELHKRAGCTDYFHELLDIIHDEMILVRSRKRIQSGLLLQKIKGLGDKSLHTDYVLISRPKPRKYPQHQAAQIDLIQHYSDLFERASACGSIQECKLSLERSETSEERSVG